MIHSEQRSPRVLGRGVQEAARANFSLTLRPWNMYEPDATNWWLVPSTDWPAYKHGKLYFKWGEAERTSLLACFHIEKGLDPSVRLAYPSAKGSRYLMNEDWTWWRLMRDLENGVFTNAVVGLAATLPMPLELEFRGGYVPDPELYDPYAEGFDRDIYQFRWDVATNRFAPNGSEAKAQVLNELAGLQTFDDLTRIARSFTAMTWVWVNLYLGIRLQIGIDEYGETLQTWNAVGLWVNCLRHFAPWLI